MIEGLRPYPEMAATGLDWLPGVPAHWETRRIKTVLTEVDRRTSTGEEKLLSLRMVAGLVGHTEAGGKLIPPKALINFKKIEPGQIVMNRMRAASGLFGIAKESGLVSPDYAVFSQHVEADLNYLLQLFKMPAMAAIFRAESKGLGTGQSGFLRLYTDRFGPIPIPFPPLEEQRLIVRFLDWHGAMTGKLIRAKRRLIALLNEQKQSVIHRAVTRGLDPVAKLKPSGVDWLGDVPAHWEVKPLKLWADINRETLGQNTPDDFAFDYIDIGSVGTGMLTASLERLTFKASPSRARRVVRLGDTIVSTVRTYLKAIWFVGEDRSDLIASTGFAVLTPKDNVSPRFFAFALQSAAFINLVISRSDGVAYPAINETRLGTLKVALPSSMAEQDAIIAHLDEATVTYDQAIAAAQSEITLIQEFRARLIADVVTGQLDVRAAAASLPDVAEGEAFAETLDDMDDEEEDALDIETEDA